MVDGGNAIPIPVRIVDIADAAQARILPKVDVPRDKILITNSYQLTLGALPTQLLAHSPKRLDAQIIINSVTSAVIAIGTSESDCQAAVTGATGQYVGDVTYIIGPYGSPIPVCGNTELWAVLVTAGASPPVISVIKTFEN